MHGGLNTTTGESALVDSTAGDTLITMDTTLITMDTTVEPVCMSRKI